MHKRIPTTFLKLCNWIIKTNRITKGKVKFWSKIAIGAIRAKLFFQLFSNKTC
jgi:hypothetical protein